MPTTEAQKKAIYNYRKSNLLKCREIQRKSYYTHHEEHIARNSLPENIARRRAYRASLHIWDITKVWRGLCNIKVDFL